MTDYLNRLVKGARQRAYQKQLLTAPIFEYPLTNEKGLKKIQKRAKLT